MDLTKFNEKYTVVSQEPVLAIFDLNLRDSVSDNAEFIDEAFDGVGYERRDELEWNGEPTWFIYENGTEIFETRDDRELLSKVKELAEELNN